MKKFRIKSLIIIILCIYSNILVFASESFNIHENSNIYIINTPPNTPIIENPSPPSPNECNEEPWEVIDWERVMRAVNNLDQSDCDSPKNTPDIENQITPKPENTTILPKNYSNSSLNISPSSENSTHGDESKDASFSTYTQQNQSILLSMSLCMPTQESILEREKLNKKTGEILAKKSDAKITFYTFNKTLNKFADYLFTQQIIVDEIDSSTSSVDRSFNALLDVKEKLPHRTLDEQTLNEVKSHNTLNPNNFIPTTFVKFIKSKMTWAVGLISATIAMTYYFWR